MLRAASGTELNLPKGVIALLVPPVQQYWGGNGTALSDLRDHGNMRSLASPVSAPPMIPSGENIVQTRLLACLAGGFLGVVVTSPINASLGLSSNIAFIGCSAIGVAVGYVASVLFDVFAVTRGDKN